MFASLQQYHTYHTHHTHHTLAPYIRPSTMSDIQAVENKRRISALVPAMLVVLTLKDWPSSREMLKPLRFRLVA